MGKVAARLRESGFFVSPKSTLEPTDSLHCLGKLFDVGGRLIANTQFSVAKLVLAWLRPSVAAYTRRCLFVYGVAAMGDAATYGIGPNGCRRSCLGGWG